MQLRASVRRLRGFGWFAVWLVLGAGLALSLISLGPLFLVAALGLVVFVGFRWEPSWRFGFGLLFGAGAVFVYVAWLNRHGPGTTCWQTGNGSGCDQNLNPLPWLGIGAALIIAALTGQLLRSFRRL